MNRAARRRVHREAMRSGTIPHAFKNWMREHSENSSDKLSPFFLSAMKEIEQVERGGSAAIRSWLRANRPL